MLVSLALIIFYTFVVPAYMYIIYKHLKRLNPNPEPASGLRRWSIGLSIWSIVAVAIGFTLGASLLLSVFNQPREIFDIDPTGQGTEIPESFPEPGDI
ncbi:MAG: hypothetical protein U5L75_02935 [Candidatus Campbellbacteria bacterium]|nr:hypothetical protein [Candidatus Campbellbacteria bacterium]